MGGMSMGGLPPLANFPQYYWVVVGTIIAIVTLVNVYNRFLCRQRYAVLLPSSPSADISRLSAAKTGRLHPARPKLWFTRAVATIFAIAREASSFSICVPMNNRILRLPTAGRTTLVLANVVLLIALCFYGFDLNDRWMRETIGYRSGFVTIGQLPLIFVLAGKNNIIGYLTGISYEQLNWIHRWCARCMLLTATIHMGYFFADWAPFGFIGTQLRENTLVWKGVVAWAMLVWIVFSSMAPIRGWCYELFVLQHLVSFAVMVGFIYIHTPAEVHIYIWLPVGIFWFDRVARVLRVLYANLSCFHPKQRRDGQVPGLWACKAEFTPLPHNTTRIVVKNPPICWIPGQHVFLSCHAILPLQSHPFTIASVPQDGRMEFLVKSETGGTRRFFRHAEQIQALPASGRSCTKTVTIEGPYGSHRLLRQFDSVVLFAGSTGATFTMPLLQDLLQGWTEMAGLAPEDHSSFFRYAEGSATRHVRFVWIVKGQGQLSWFAEQLSSIQSSFTSLQEKLKDIKLELTVYVTCDDAFTKEHKSLMKTLPKPHLAAVPQRPQVLHHGIVEERSRASLLYENNKLGKINGTNEKIEEVSLHSPSRVNDVSVGGPDGSCYCKTKIDETSSDAIQPICCCSHKENQQASARSQSEISSTPSTKQLKSLLHPSILIYSGRPNTKDIIRKSLEQALGESAVMVCGPHSLTSDVKRHVCSLSDERAVHKGTGAQGIYLHMESFGY
jgi:predicted ferric reductase